MKIELLEAIARQMVGDGIRPNIYIVTRKGAVETITRHLPTAYARWRQIVRDSRDECALEDRLVGVLASREPDDDNSRRLVIFDDVATAVRELYS